ncbi:putative efflux protein, MATE family [Treponema bryantii]|uniref:Multidrug export protein MepA n=1 Tax=Treponema bryantii TaxID=163 RepID=A0A1H9FKF4_9SPIR|nr:MATE family efflux transporter [Treponema bryantii]SEQ38460.1 putative efflux protein, MATE family [Treponema bryantii]
MSDKQDTREMLVSGNVFKTMLTLSVPAVLGMVVIGLYNFMDAVFVGQMVGPVAMTAVKVSYPFTLINSGIATLIGVGSSSVLSRAIGERDQETVDKIMGNLISFVSLLSVIVIVAGLIFTRQLLSLAGAEGEVLEQAVRYLRVVFCGSLFVNLGQSTNMIMRGEGKLKKAMAIMATSAILNIILDPVLIKVCGEGNGVLGAAFATIISQIVLMIMSFFYFLKKSDTVKIHKIKFEKTLIKPVLSVGVSAMLMQVMSMLQQTVLYNTASKWGGSEWQTILGAALSLQAFSFIPLWGISQGFQPAIGTNYGAKLFDRVGKFTRCFMVSATVVALIFYIPIMCLPAKMLSMFITDAAIVEAGAPMLRVLFGAFITYGVLILAITFFQAIGKASAASILALLRQLFLFLPLVLLLPNINGLGIKGVFYAQLFTDLIVLALAVIFMCGAFGRFRRA